MYFSGSAAKAPILFGGVRAGRMAEDQVQRNPENGQHRAGGRGGEGGATRAASTGTTATAPILFGGVRAGRLAEDQVQRNPENGQHRAGGREGEGAATREVATAPERPDEEEAGVQHH